MKIFLFLLPVILFLIILYMKLVFPGIYIFLVQEGSAFESMQFLFYFMSSILSFLVSSKFLKNKMPLHGVLYGLLAIGLLLISLEEISWGQRIFHITTPGYFAQKNVQHEMTLHNLPPVQTVLHKIYIFVGAYGAFAWIFLYLFIPKTKAQQHHIVNFVVPDWFISSYFFFTFFIYTLFEYIVTPEQWSFLIWRDQEPMEFLLSLGFLLFASANYIRLRICLQTQPEGTKDAHS